uniref:Uncharacterized protein n=1 Tax=Strongyloides papillosus TaxID=174720 RepID=A0A0N5B7A6_STREA
MKARFRKNSYSTTFIPNINREEAASINYSDLSTQNLLLTNPRLFVSEILKLNNQQSGQRKMNLLNDVHKLTDIFSDIPLKEMFHALLNVDSCFGPLFNEVIETSEGNEVCTKSECELKTSNNIRSQKYSNSFNINLF